MRVLIVDDDPIVVESLTTILGVQPDVDVVGTAGNGPEAVRRYADRREPKPDVVLMDVRMPEGDGLTAGETIMAEDPDARVVYLTTFSDDDYIVRALRLGAKGYLIKQQARSIAPALREVMAGKTVLGDEVADLANATNATRTTDTTGTTGTTGIAGKDSSRNSSPADEPTPLTARERTIVNLIAEGLDNREIANELHLSEGTVRNHISTILAKLALRNRTQIAVWSWRRRSL